MSKQAGVLVMGSGSLTDINDMSSPAVLSSLTLAAIRRLPVPVLVVTANTRAPGAQGPVSNDAAMIRETETSVHHALTVQTNKYKLASNQ